MRMTIDAPLSLARSDGRGSKLSGSAAGGTMLSTWASVAATKCARLARSVVVATIRSGCAIASCADETAARTANANVWRIPAPKGEVDCRAERRQSGGGWSNTLMQEDPTRRFATADVQHRRSWRQERRPEAAFASPLGGGKARLTRHSAIVPIRERSGKGRICG